MRGRAHARLGRGSITVAVFSALVTATLMSAGFSYYLAWQQGSLGQQRERLKAVTDRNALLQGELLKLNSSVAGVMSGLDTVSRAVQNAKIHLQHTKPGAAPAQSIVQLEDDLQSLRQENQLLKAQAARIAPQLAAAAAPAQAAPSGASESGSGGQERWLTIGIPTVPRRHGERYLEQTLSAIAQQLPLRHEDPNYRRVMIVVLNNQPGKHAVFDAARAKYEAGPYAAYFKFVEQSVAQSDSFRNQEGNPNVPSSKVRIQTRAAVAMLRASAGLASHFLFMEDDFVLCPNALHALEYIIAKVYAYRPVGFSGIRVSYGLCGVILNDRDVSEFANYLEQVYYHYYYFFLPALHLLSAQKKNRQRTLASTCP